MDLLDVMKKQKAWIYCILCTQAKEQLFYVSLNISSQTLVSAMAGPLAHLLISEHKPSDSKHFLNFLFTVKDHHSHE